MRQEATGNERASCLVPPASCVVSTEGCAVRRGAEHRNRVRNQLDLAVSDLNLVAGAEQSFASVRSNRESDLAISEITRDRDRAPLENEPSLRFIEAHPDLSVTCDLAPQPNQAAMPGKQLGMRCD